MNRFERMIAIPEDEYDQMRSLQQLRQVKYPMEAYFQSLSNDYRKQGAIQDPYTRVHRQGETLEEMINVKDLLRQRLIDATPKVYQNRAESLFNYMKDKIRVNEQGEIVKDDGYVIEGSNIGDLIQHAVRDRRRNLTPVGWDTFVTRLKDTNAPKMVLSYDTLDELRPSSQSMLPNVASAKQKSINIKIPSVKQEPHTSRRDIWHNARAKPVSESKRKSTRKKRSPSYLRDYK